jgi:hypothetical protein
LRNAFQELDAFALPGVGSFEKVYRGAYMDSEGRIVHPPVVELVYLPEVKSAWLLSHHLIHNLHMTPEAASQLTEALRKEISENLEKKGFYEIQELGRIVKKKEGGLQILLNEPERNMLSEEFYGLLPVTASHKNPNTQKHSSMTEAHPIGAPGFDPRSAWKPALLVLIIAGLGVALAIYGPFSRRRASLAEGVKLRFEPPALLDVSPAPLNDLPRLTEERTAPPASQREEVPARPQPAPGLIAEGPRMNERDAGVSRSSEGDDPFGPVGELSTLDDAPASTARKPGPTAEVMYHLVAGSYTSLAAANKFKSQMEAQGYTPAIIPPTPSVSSYRVAIFSATDRKSVSKFAEELKRNGKNPGWILEEKP